jgi:NTE family protein
LNTAPLPASFSPSTRTFRWPRSEQDQSQIDGTGQSRAKHGRALVLHGGGSAGNAWEIGVIAGLFNAGLDVTEADLIIGTSAGATATAQVTAASPPELLTAILDGPSPQRVDPSSPSVERPPLGPVIDHMERTNQIIATAKDAADMRRRMGAAALEMDATSDGSGNERWRAIVAARLPSHRWPEQAILITAVDACTGEPVVFDRQSGVDLVDAVAASTANGFGVPPFGIGNDRFIDGGYRRNENADLAVGYERVLVLSPFGGRSRHPDEWRMQLAAQIDELRSSGSTIEAIVPDRNSLDAFGTNMMDPSTRRPSALAGYGQGMAYGERLTKFWR